MPSHTDDAMLDSFFAAARADTPAPRAALLSAILADAAEMHAARAAAPPAARIPPPFHSRLAGLLSPIGGWRGLGALGACAGLGFWLGAAGHLTLDGAALTAGISAGAADGTTDSTVEGVDAFFDYAFLEQ